jgi:hypothetical protein
MTLFPVDPVEAVPGRSRKTDPETSKQAAKKAVCTVTWGSHRARLLIAYQEHGSLTDEQCGIYARIPRVSDTRRCSELRAAGLIAPTGQKRKTRTKSDAMVCAITDAGRKALYRARQAVKK